MQEEIRVAYGKAVRAIRQNKKISQEETRTIYADLHRTYISDIELGKRNVSLENIDLINQTFTNEKVKYKNPYEGMYSMYNAAAVMALAKYYHIDYSYVQKVFESALNQREEMKNLT